MSFRSFVLLCVLVVYVNACTNYIVTKGASVDGATLYSYAADDGPLYGAFGYYPAADHPAGTMRDIWDWDTQRYLGQIPEANHTYNVVGNINEWNLAIGETTFGGLDSLSGQDSVLDYGSLIWITLQRSKNAREAIQTMGNLVEEYGYASEGESFTIADPNEVWILELIGKGKGEKGAVWVASRVPDGYVSGHANQARTRTFPLNDPENCIYAHDVIDFAIAKKLYPANGKKEDFSFSDVYDPVTPSGCRLGELRVWNFFRNVSTDPSFGATYMDYVSGYNLTNRMPLWIKPKEKVSVHDLMNYMRTHFEDTYFDMRVDVGSGPFHAAFRVRPLVWTSGNQNYLNERPVGVQQTGWHMVAQLRGWLPREVGSLLWFGVDDISQSVHFPVFGSMTRVPPSWAASSGNSGKFSFDSAFWVFNMVANLAYSRYSDIHPEVAAKIVSLETGYLAAMENVTQTAVALLKVNSTKAIDFLTDYSNTVGEALTKEWLQFWQYLFVKYRDGFTTTMVKPTNPKDRPAVDCGEGGYDAQWYKRIVAETGNHYLIPATDEKLRKHEQRKMKFL